MIPSLVPGKDSSIFSLCKDLLILASLRLSVWAKWLTVSLVSPSFIWRMSLAASRFLSRLQSSFRDTKPLRSSFSTYCCTHNYILVPAHYYMQKDTQMLYNLELTWVSLALLKKYKEFPHRHVHSRLDACHIQMDTQTWTKNVKQKRASAVFPVSVMDIFLLSPPHFLSLEMAVVSEPQLLSICGHGSLRHPAPEPCSHYMSTLH